MGKSTQVPVRETRDFFTCESKHGQKWYKAEYSVNSHQKQAQWMIIKKPRNSFSMPPAPICITPSLDVTFGQSESVCYYTFTTSTLLSKSNAVKYFILHTPSSRRAAISWRHSERLKGHLKAWSLFRNREHPLLIRSPLACQLAVRRDATHEGPCNY